MLEKSVADAKNARSSTGTADATVHNLPPGKKTAAKRTAAGKKTAAAPAKKTPAKR
ncbi:hypothetical protein [Streptomyces sp. NPDC049949]|uniref:hypothetical protein n=1 Tax=Streptomyces sp. NPDC049949 TaxID=3154627 RepID=UPI003413378A